MLSSVRHIAARKICAVEYLIGGIGCVEKHIFQSFFFLLCRKVSVALGFFGGEAVVHKVVCDKALYFVRVGIQQFFHFLKSVQSQLVVGVFQSSLVFLALQGIAARLALASDYPFRRVGVGLIAVKDSVGFFAVSARSADLLKISLYILGQLIVYDPPDICLVNTHAEGAGGKDDPVFFGLAAEKLLVIFLVIEVGIVSQHRDICIKHLFELSGQKAESEQAVYRLLSGAVDYDCALFFSQHLGNIADKPRQLVGVFLFDESVFFEHPAEDPRRLMLCTVNIRSLVSEHIELQRAPSFYHIQLFGGEDNAVLAAAQRAQLLRDILLPAFEFNAGGKESFLFFEQIF